MQLNSRITFNRIYIDSRSIVSGNHSNDLFVALSSPNNDGHIYLSDAYAKGIRRFLVEHTPENLGDFPDSVFYTVNDTVKELQAMGTAARDSIGNPEGVIAITGSRGKTQLKEMLYQAFTRAGRTVSRSPRSYNSQIGVPLSLLGISGEAELTVIEAGISREGEMNALADIIRPTTGVLTNITSEHSDGFSSRQSHISEKLNLFKDCTTIIYNAADDDVDEAVKKRYSDRRLIAVKADSAAATLKALASAVLVANGISKEEASRLLEGADCVDTRLNVIEGMNGCKLIYDRFTNDSDSLASALDFLNRRVDNGLRRTLILATDSFTDNAESLAELIVAYRIDRILLVGEKRIEINGAEYYPSVSALCEALSANDFHDTTIVLKGIPADGLDSFYYMLEAKQHETVLEVNLDAMIANFNFFRSKVKHSTGVICMLKAAGYGAGSVELARALQSQGAAYIAVAVVDEGVELRRAGISMPVIVLNPRAQNHKMMFDYHLEPEIYSFDMLEEIIESARRYGVSGFPVHIKLETGMRRLGFTLDEIDRLGSRLSECQEVTPLTAFSHLACADDPAEDDYTRSQFETFRRGCDILDSHLKQPVKRHILNSTGIVRFPEEQHDFVRLGIGLYGIPTMDDGSMSALRPVSSLSSVIISIKHWKKGDTIGYNRRGRLERDSVIATVPIGYADGLDRHLGYGNASFSVNGHRCPTVGSICMDICMIDVTDVDCRVNDRVEIFGPEVSATELADVLNTIPYEILTSISPRVKRVYYRE